MYEKTELYAMLARLHYEIAMQPEIKRNMKSHGDYASVICGSRHTQTVELKHAFENLEYSCRNNELMKKLEELRKLFEASGIFGNSIYLSNRDESTEQHELDDIFTTTAIYMIENNGMEEIITITEAAEIWGLDTSTLRKALTGGFESKNFKSYRDYRKSGNVWLVTKSSMIREYGSPKIVKIEFICETCSHVFAEEVFEDARGIKRNHKALECPKCGDYEVTATQEVAKMLSQYEDDAE